MVTFESVVIKPGEGVNVILGQAHFIKSVEDIYEALVNAAPGVKFGVAFCEASGPCLVRCEGNDVDLQKLASEKALELGCGHCFIVLLQNAYPINVIDKVKAVPEVCSIFAATANPVEVIVAETEQGRGIMGVIDGSKPKGAESETDVAQRKAFLRMIGYKL